MNFKFASHRHVGSYFLKFFKKDGGDYTNPVRDWTLGLFFAVTLFFAGVVYIALDFYEQFGTSKEALVTEGKSEVYREKEVRMFAEIYSQKEQVFMELRGEKKPDPEPLVVAPPEVVPAPISVEEALETLPTDLPLPEAELGQ